MWSGDTIRNFTGFHFEHNKWLIRLSGTWDFWPQVAACPRKTTAEEEDFIGSTHLSIDTKETNLMISFSRQTRRKNKNP